MSLVKVSLKGAFWLGLLQFSIKLFSFIKLIIVARILNPIDFGLFGMIIIPYGLLEVATEPGINQALIQTRKNPRKYFSSIQITFLFRGLFLFLILYFFAPIISKFYNNNLTQAIRIIALAPLTRGFINPAIVLFKKNMQFKKIFFFRLLTSISESLFTIYFALKFQSMIALPLGVVVGTISATILSYLMVKIEFTAIKFKNIIELYKYGKWVTIGTLLSYINDQGDDFVVSKVLGARLLGYYQTAYKISNLPTTQGAGLIYQIIFPIFSSIQNNSSRLKRGVLKSLGITFIFSLFFGLFIYKFSPILIELILGKEWLPMIPALNILIIFGILRPLISVGVALFDAVGQPNLTATVNLIKLIALVIFIFPLIHKFGIIGVAWAVVIAQIAVYPWFIVKLVKTLK